MPSPLPRRAHHALVREIADARRHRPGGERVTGHHNANYIAPLGWPLALLLGVSPFGTRAKYRTPLDTVEVVPRIWPNEADVLRVVARHLPEAPRCLADFGDWSLHEYRPGRALSEVLPHGPIGHELLTSFADFFARTASIPAPELPARPADWPRDGDSTGFLHWLIDFTEQRVHRPHRERFGELFDAVGIPRTAMARFKAGQPGLRSRPFCLLHTDVHRANAIVDGDGDGDGGVRLTVIDWELGLYGDPLHDLATHVVRMNYDKDEQEQLTELWARAMTRAGHEAMTAGLDRDLPVYLGFEYAQSVFPDVMRAALSLPDAAEDEDFTRAARSVRRAMRRAREPLRLVDLASGRQVVEALRAWHAARA